MLNWQSLREKSSQHRLFVIATVGITIALTIVLISPLFQQCIQGNQQPHTNQPFYERSWIFIKALWWCGGIFAKENGEAITGLASVSIAIFTLTLWLATTEQGRLTQQSVKIANRALTDLERPYLYITIEGKLEYDITGGGLYTLYNVTNHGRMPATIEDVIVSLAPSVAGEPDPGLHEMAEHRLRAKPVIGPGKRRRNIKAAPPGNIGFTGTTSGELVLECPDDGEVFMQIQILYRGPFTKSHSTLGSWRIDEMSNRFVEFCGWDEKYNHIK